MSAHPAGPSAATTTAMLWLALLAALPASAAPAPDQALQRYQQERASCLNGRSGQDRPTCLREAGAALAEARRGALGSGDADLPANQRQRCQPLPAGDREACLARMAGQGTTSGSAAAGGISRDLVQRIPAATAPPPAASAASR